MREARRRALTHVFFSRFHIVCVSRNERSPKKGIDTISSISISLSFPLVEMREARRRALTHRLAYLEMLGLKSRNERSPKKGIDIFFLFLYWWVERRSSMKNTDTLRSRLWLGVWESRKEKRKNNWINISSNDAVKKFIQMSDNLTTKWEIENLLADEFISCVCQACA